MARLGKITRSEKAKVSKKDLEKIARAASGGFRDAETLLQQVIEGEIPVETLLSSMSKDTFIDFTDLILAKDTKAMYKQVNKAFEDANVDQLGLDV